MTRIVLTDKIQDTIIKLAEGNPGALTVCVEIIKVGDRIDRDSFHGGLGALLCLDSLEIYGSDIWCLFKDVCRENITLMIAVLRGYRLGFVSKDELKHAIGHYGEGIDTYELYKKVKEQLPNFKQMPKLIFIQDEE